MNYTKFRILVLFTFLFVSLSVGKLSAQTETALGSTQKGGAPALSFISPATAVANLRAAALNVPVPVTSRTQADRDLMKIRAHFYNLVANEIESGISIADALSSNSVYVSSRVALLSGVPSNTADIIVAEGTALVTQ